MLEVYYVVASIYMCSGGEYNYIYIEQGRYNINVFIRFEMELYQCGAIFYLV